MQSRVIDFKHLPGKNDAFGSAEILCQRQVYMGESCTKATPGGVVEQDDILEGEMCSLNSVPAGFMATQMNNHPSTQGEHSCMHVGLVR